MTWSGNKSFSESVAQKAFQGALGNKHFFSQNCQYQKDIIERDDKHPWKNIYLCEWALFILKATGRAFSLTAVSP